MRFVLDVLGEDIEAVDLGGEPRGDGGARLVAAFGDFARRARGVGGDDGLMPSLRITLRHWPSAWTWLSTVLMPVERRALRRQQLVPHRQEILGHDVQAGVRHQVMDVGDAAGDRILDRDHAELGLAGRDRREGILEGRAGHGSLSG